MPPLAFRDSDNAGRETRTIDGDTVNGNLGANTSGMIDGLPASLGMQGSDLVLRVVPEPGTLAMLAAGVVVLLQRVWRRKRLI